MTPLTDRELRLMGDMLMAGAWDHIKLNQDVIAKREGVTRERICQQASKLLRTIRLAQEKVAQ